MCWGQRRKSENPPLSRAEVCISWPAIIWQFIVWMGQGRACRLRKNPLRWTHDEDSMGRYWPISVLDWLALVWLLQHGCTLMGLVMDSAQVNSQVRQILFIFSPAHRPSPKHKLPFLLLEDCEGPNSLELLKAGDLPVSIALMRTDHLRASPTCC